MSPYLDHDATAYPTSGREETLITNAVPAATTVLHLPELGGQAADVMQALRTRASLPRPSGIKRRVSLLRTAPRAEARGCRGETPGSAWLEDFTRSSEEVFELCFLPYLQPSMSWLGPWLFMLYSPEFNAFYSESLSSLESKLPWALSKALPLPWSLWRSPACFLSPGSNPGEKHLDTCRLNTWKQFRLNSSVNTCWVNVEEWLF